MDSEEEHAALEQLIYCLTNRRLATSIEVASATLIFYDWLLTSSDELDWLRRRGRNIYARILFILARYPALASLIVGLLPLTIVLRSVTTYLSVLTIICSELVLAMRTWAVWESRPSILVFLVVLTIVCAVPGIVIIGRDMVTTVVVPTWSGMQQCRVLTSAIKRAWVVPYIGIMVFEVALTLYKVLQCYKMAPTKRSKLLDVLWIDGAIYFVFMLLLGMLNVGLALHVSNSHLRAGCTQLQTASHSVLSTRIVLHTGRVLRGDSVDAQPCTRMVREDGSRSRASGVDSVELQRLMDDGM